MNKHEMKEIIQNYLFLERNGTGRITFKSVAFKTAIRYNNHDE